VKSSLRREEDLLVLLFDKALAAFSQSSNLKGLIMFLVMSAESEQEDLFNHSEWRALAAMLALNLLNFCETHAKAIPLAPP
jgi:hypothetical protein